MVDHRDRQVALCKVLAAAAWADGRLDPEEVERIRGRMLAQGLRTEDVSEISRLLEAPVSYAQAEELTRELLTHLRTREERAEALAQIESLLRVDGKLEAEEAEMLEGMRGAMGSQDELDSFVGRVTGVFRRVFAARRAGGPPGEITQYLKNEVLRCLHEVSGGAWRSEIDAASLNRHTLFGAVLGRIAGVEAGLAPAELEQIREILRERFFLSPPLLDWTVQAVAESATVSASRQGLLSEYNRISTMEERITLLDAAFAVAAADGAIDRTEIDELRLISNFMWIDPRDFHRVRARWGSPAA